MKTFLLAFLILAGICPVLMAQKYTLSGYVKDAQTGEDIIGAVVSAPDLTLGTSTNAYGYYILQLPPSQDSVTIKVAFVGYKDFTKKILLTSNQTLHFNLTDGQELEAVEVEVSKFQQAIDETQMSVSSLSAKEIKSVPVIFGETDLIKVLQLKPGVKSGTEGSAGLYVRGGGPDQNLILLDEATVYNASHLFGFFSIFNSDAIKNVDLYKGDFPAQYGGRLSSVLDIKMNEGNKKRLSGTGGVGLISSRLTLEGPIKKDKSSFIVSGRRTYFDIITRQINKANEGKPDYNPIPDYFFYDLNGKVNFELGPKDRLFASGYFGRDVFKFNGNNFNFDFDWGNTMATLRWNHVFSPRLFANTSAIFSDYRYNISNEFRGFKFNISSSVRDYNFKYDFDYSLSRRHSLRFGAQYVYHEFEVGRVNFNSSDGRVDFSSGRDFVASEMGAYINDDFEINPRLRWNLGLRVSGFESNGKWFGGLEPRTALRYKLDEKTSLKGSFSQVYQYLHLVSNSGASLPTDIWYPSTRIVRPQLSQQAAAGISTLLGGDKFLLSNEIYYKWMLNQIDFRDGANLFINDNLDQEFVFGRGWSYGTEVYLEKKQGKLTGWIGYTLAWTYRQFADSSNGNAPIDNGRAFFPRYDRRHDVSVVIIYQHNKKWNFSFNWVYGTGNAVSLPVGRFVVQDITGANPTIGNEFTERNGFRMPAYHRADLSITRKFKPKWGESELSLSIYNLYNRRNAFIIYFEPVDQTDAPPNQDIPENPNISVIQEFATPFRARQLALFPIIPTLTYNFKF